MSDRPSGGLTPGDPLGGSAPERRPSEGLWSGTPGYTTPAPPGAGGPRPAAVPAGLPGRPVLSGWWRRVIAQLIDGAIILLGAAVVLGILAAAGLSIDSEGGLVALIVAALLSVLVISVVALLYAPLLMARTNGKTVGRMAVGIRVIRPDGRPMSFGFALLREVLVKTLLFGVISSATFGLASLLDVLWPLWDEENRALHDLIVNTRVIRD